MQDIAAYFSGTPLKVGNAPVGTTPKAADLCVTCHGKNGVGIRADVPFPLRAA